MSLTCIAPPLVEPVSLPELKAMLRMSPTDTSQDGVLVGLNVAARTWVETILQRKCVQQTWRLGMDFFPGYIDLKLSGQRVSSPFVSGSNAVLVGIRYAIVLPFPPIQSLVAFTYQDANGSVTNMITSPPSFVQDLISQPARLTPLFGQMWPVARVVVNAVQIDFQCGFATPTTLSIAANASLITGATFTAANVGQPISIPGAGPSGDTLNTIVQSVVGGAASVRDTASTTVTNATGLLINYGTPGYWELIKTGIKFLVNEWYVHRIPNYGPELRDAVKAILGPARDERY